MWRWWRTINWKSEGDNRAAWATQKKEISTQNVFSSQRKNILYFNSLYFYLFEKNFYNSLKINSNFPKKKNLPGKTIFQTKNFLCLFEKLISCTGIKQLKCSTLVVFWIHLCFCKLLKLNKKICIFKKRIRVLVCSRIYF